MNKGNLPAVLHFPHLKKVVRNFFEMKFLCIVFLFTLLLSSSSYATHISGADMSYRWISGNTFELTLTLYRDCSGIAAPNSVSINYKSISCGYNLNTTLNKIAGTGQEITRPCPTASTNCTGGSSPGIQQYEYTGTITLPAQCTDWVFGYSICCRNCAITTLSYTPNNCSGVPATYVEATLNNLTSPTNSSPIFTNVPVSFFCIGQPFHYNHGAYDTDGDSLVYSFIDPRSASATNVTFIAGYSASNPISSSPPISLGYNGDILMNPTAMEVGVMAILVKEYRNGVLIGTVVRDMEVWTYACSNTLPTASGINGSNNFSIVACPGANLSFNINSADIDVAQNVIMDWNYSIPGATFTSTPASRPVGTFSWTPTLANVRSQPYVFTVTVIDNNCPSNGFQTYSYSITVPDISVSTTSTNSACSSPGSGTATALPTGDAPFSYLWTPGSGNTQTINGLTAGIYTVKITDANGCTSTANATVNSPTPVNATFLGTTNASCFGSTNGTISVSAFGGTAGYSYSWSPSGGSSPFAIGLAAGTYAVTITDSHGCTYSTSTTITQPPVLSASSISTPLSCNNDGSGWAFVSPAGGTASYNYSWSTGATTSSINNLSAGNYSVIVTDAHNCTVSSSVNVTQPNILNGNLLSTTNVSCNAGNNGGASISANGGTLPYVYSWSPTGGSLANATNLVAGNYVATVTDAHNCTATVSVNINQPTTLVCSISTFGNALCAGDSSGFAHATQSGGTPPYSYSWTPTGENSPIVTGLKAGSYSVTVTDANGCNSVSSITITEPNPIALSVVSTNNVSCFGGSDGSAIVATSGGTSSYNYQWSSSGINSASENNLSAGTYLVNVTDANNCKDSLSININQPTALSAITASSNTNCFAGNDGFATVTPAGGTGPYNYLWAPGNATTDLISGLTPGNYNVTVTDSKGCSYSLSANINEPTDLSIATSTNNSTCGNTNGSAFASVNGGTPGYTYSWSPGSSFSSSLNNVAAGTYVVTITDANGCTSSATAGVSNNGAPTVTLATLTGVSCNGGNNGIASVNAAGGFAPFRYLWSPYGGTSQSASGLTAGTYSVRVTNRHNCSTVMLVDVPEPPALQTNISSTPVTCFGGNDGSVITTTSGGTGSYNYLWNNGIGNVPSGNSLVAGNYSVTISDQNGCTVSSNIAVNQPTLLGATLSGVTPVSCYGGNNGAASIITNGGTAPYSYNWNTTGNISSIDNALAAGSYPVTITDASGCTTTIAAVINQPSQLSATTATSNVTCNLSNGTASVNISGGVGPYTYLWNQTGDTTTLVSGLVPGNYMVTATDINGCTVTSFANVPSTNMVSATIASLSNVSCNSGNDGSAMLNVIDGTPPYNFNWQPFGGNSQVAGGLSAGNYNVIVTDADNCSITIPLSIIEPPAISSSVFITHIKCAGDGNGFASINVSGGTGAYTYQWLPGGQNTSSISSLNGGNYTITVTDANGCSSSTPIVVNEPTPVALSTSSTQAGCYLSNGSATVVATGGTPPFNYLWSPGAMQSSVASGIPAGAYSVTVTDSYNCITSASASVSNPTGPSASLVSSTPANCYGSSDGTAEINVSGGTAPFVFTWSPSGGSSAIANNLPAGSYSATVRDSNNCFAAIPVTINEPPQVNASITPAPATCFGAADGSASVITGGGTPPYNFNWSNGDQTSSAFALSSGTYTLTIVDANGCPSTYNTFVAQPSDITLDVATAPAKCNGRNTGYASIVPSGGTPGYTYLWSTGSIYSSGTNFFAGNYTVTIKDAHGCQVDTSITIAEPPLLVANAIPVNISCPNLQDGHATVVVSGGVPPYSYEWTPNGGNTDSTSNLNVGSHAIKVRDSNGCVIKDDFYIGAPQPLALSTAVTAVKCFGGNNGTVGVSVLGGIPPYSYIWNSGSTTSLASNLQAGTYTVTVSDSNSCLAQATGYITQPTPLNLSIDNSLPICIGQSTILNAQCSGGTPGYLYTWNNGTHYAQLPVSPTTTTTYSVSVVDAHTCPSNVATISLTVHPPLLAGITAPDTICESNYATLIATGSGGNGGPYNYTWDNGNSGNYNTVAPVATTVYTVTVSDLCGTPPVTMSVHVVVNPNPVVDFTPRPSEGCQPLLVNFDDLTNSTASQYYWSFGDGSSDTTRSPSHVFLNPGNYTVNHLVVTDKGCKGRIVVPDAVKVYPVPIAEFTNTPEVTSIYNPIISFTDASTNAARWEWDFGDNTHRDSNRNPEHTYGDTGTFTIRLITISDHGCVDTVYGKVIIKGEFAFYIPNAFTPNNDGVNDSFIPLGIGVKDYEMSIYDRWGIKIFYSEDIEKGWDGRVQGSETPCQMDVYVYRIVVGDIQGKSHSYVGRVSLVR